MRLLYRFLILTALLATALQAMNLPSFEIEGNVKEKQKLTAKNIESLGTKEYSFYDPYLKKDVTYTGVLLTDFIEAYQGETPTNALSMKALDGYLVEFFRDEWERDKIVIATKIDGEYMSYKDLGPIKIVYPEYKESSKDKPSDFIKWIWMVKTIEFK